MGWLLTFFWRQGAGLLLGWRWHWHWLASKEKKRDGSVDHNNEFYFQAPTRLLQQCWPNRVPVSGINSCSGCSKAFIQTKCPPLLPKPPNCHSNCKASIHDRPPLPPPLHVPCKTDPPDTRRARPEQERSWQRAGGRVARQTPMGLCCRSRNEAFERRVGGSVRLSQAFVRGCGGGPGGLPRWFEGVVCF